MMLRIERATNSCQLRQQEAGARACEQPCLLPPSGISSHEHGFSLVSAIFLLVVIAMLGTFAVTLSTTQQQSAALDIMGSRAYQAAHTGIEWGAYQVVPGSALDFASSCRANGSNSQIISPLSGTLANCTVTVNCVATSHTEGASTVWGYQLSASATQGALNTAGYVERHIASDIWIVVP